MRILETLSYKQLFKIIWWRLFNKKKINIFCESLDAGKSAIFAYKDAEKIF
jgi:hypothetical protein